jgi:hypothetical protein
MGITGLGSIGSIAKFPSTPASLPGLTGGLPGAGSPLSGPMANWAGNSTCDFNNPLGSMAGAAAPSTGGSSFLQGLGQALIGMLPGFLGQAVSALIQKLTQPPPQPQQGQGQGQPQGGGDDAA